MDTKMAVSKIEGGGGYECEFVEKPTEVFQTECLVCLQILRDPYQVLCCGKSYCQPCLERVKQNNKPCPHCNEENFTDFPNKGLQQSLKQLHVQCENKGEGCEWTGELGELDNHLNMEPQPDKQLHGCMFVKIECIYCSERCIRDSIEVHQNDTCPKRPIDCEYCENYKSNYDDITNNHWPVCPNYPIDCPNKCDEQIQRKDLEHHVAEECPLTVVECRFHYAGCETKLPRQEMQTHLNDKQATHLEILEIKYKRLEAMYQCSEECHSSIEARYRQYCRLPPLEFTMPNYSYYRRNNMEWYSPHFYTDLGGYKLCLRVDASGAGESKARGGSHLSVQLCMMKGEFDDKLDWVFRGEVQVEVVGTRYKPSTNIYNTKESGDARQRVLNGERATISWGSHGSYHMIYNRDIYDYVRNDSITFRVVHASRRRSYLFY